MFSVLLLSDWTFNKSCGVDDLLFRSVNFVDAIVRTFAKKI